MEFKFDAATFVMVQNLVYPLVTALANFKPEEWVGEKSELFMSVGDALADISTLFTVAGSAIEDGRLTVEEIEEIITQAATIPVAIDKIVGFFEEDVPEIVPAT